VLLLEEVAVMKRALFFLSAASVACAILVTVPAPGEATIFRRRIAYGPARYRPSARLPGWDWRRTYPWSPYNIGRNPYNPLYVSPVYPPPIYGYPGYPGYAYASPPTVSGGNLSTVPSSADLNYTPADAAMLRIRVPAVRARVTVNGRAISPIGNVRYYVTPTLSPGQTYSYTVRASWTRDGRTVTRQRTVRAQRGRTVVVDFTAPAPKRAVS